MSRFNPIKAKTVPQPEISPDEIQPENIPQLPTQKKISAPCVCGVKLTFNQARNGLQLHFAAKPDEDIRAELKAAGWRWSFKNHCWYHRDTPANRDFAEQFVTRFDSGRPQKSEPSPVIIPLPPANNSPGLPAWRQRLFAHHQKKCKNINS